MSAEWPKARLGEVLTPVARGEAPVSGKPYRQLGVKLWGEGAYQRETIDGAETKYAQLFRAETGDVVVNKIWARNGSVAVVPSELTGSFGSGEFPMFSPKLDRITPAWIHWLTKTKDFWAQCDEKSQGTSGQNRIRPEKFLEIEIPFPPLAEQQRIVERIEALAAQIREAQRLRQESAEAAEVLLSARISSLFDDDFYWKSVQDAVSTRKGAVRSGPFGSQLRHEEFTPSGIPAIGTRDVQTNQFSLRGGWYVSAEKFAEVQRYQVFPGDVLCTIVGASIGRFCVVPDDVPLAFTTKHIQALTLDLTKAEPYFISIVLNYHRRCRASLFAQVEGSAQPSLNATKVLGTALPLPSLSEQRRVVVDFLALHAEIDALQRHQTETAAELDALLPAILDRAFKGELR